MHELIFEVLRDFIWNVLSIQSIFSFVKLLQCCTERLLLRSFRPAQKQPHIDDPQYWSENYSSILQKYLWWNTTEKRSKCAPRYFPNNFRTTSSLNNSGRPLLSSPSLSKAFVSLIYPWLLVTEFTYIFD